MYSSALINGNFISDAKEYYDVINPSSMQVVARVAKLGKEEAIRAVEAAETAFKSYSKLTGKERAKLLENLASKMRQNRDLLAKTMVLENGKVWKEALSEVDYSIAFVDWFSEEAKRIYGEIIPPLKQGQRLFGLKQPIGVVGAITPWNFPLAMIARKVSPAIAAGCTIVLKPSEETPLSAYLFGKLCMEAGFPAGVVNILSGDYQAIGEVLTDSNAVRMLTFTGSTRVGKLMMSKAANTVKKVAMELGGNAPFIVFEDADLELSADQLIASKLRNGGQSCICANRIYIHESIEKELIQLLDKRLKGIKVGDGFDESAHLGPMINKAAVTKIHSLLDDSKAKGGEILYSTDLGGLTQQSSCFIAPMMIKNNNPATEIEQNEIFGPIISLFTFKDEDEVIARANNSNYGLASYFFTQNKDRAWRVSEALEYGMVGCNDVGISSEFAIFGGVKESGIGREGSKEGILEYLEHKFIVMS